MAKLSLEEMARQSGGEFVPATPVETVPKKAPTAQEAAQESGGEVVPAGQAPVQAPPQSDYLQLTKPKFDAAMNQELLPAQQLTPQEQLVKHLPEMVRTFSPEQWAEFRKNPQFMNPEFSAPTTTGGVLGAVARGNPITGMAGMLGDIANPAVQALGGKPIVLNPDDPEAGSKPPSQQIQEWLTGLGVKEPQSSAEKFTQLLSGFIPIGPMGKKPGEIAPEGAPLAAAPVVEAEASQVVGDLVRKAKGSGGSAAAMKIAEMAPYDQEAMKAAKELGLEIPSDVFSDSPQIRAAAGLARSLAGGPAEGAWRSAVRTSMDKVDDIFKKFNANYVDSTPSSSAVGEQIKQAMTTARGELKSQYTPLYDEVNAAIPKPTEVAPINTRQFLDDLARDVGGAENFSDPNLARLYKTLKSKDPTYGLFMQEKQGLFDAMSRKNSLWADAGEKVRNDLYDAMAKDQLDIVGRVGSPETADKLKAANLLYSQKKGLDERAAFLYGEKESKDLERVLNSAMQGEAGNKSAGQFNAILKAIPEEYQKDAIATSLAAITRGKQEGTKGFGFAQFADAYPALRSHPETFAQISKVMGPDAMETYRNLYLVSKVMNRAQSNVITTGKANQVLSNAMQADGLIAKVLDSRIGNAAVAGLGGTMGPVGAASTAMVAKALAENGRGSLQAASKLFASDKFQSLLENVATNGVKKSALEAFAASPEFSAFAKTTGIPPGLPARVAWLTAATAQNAEALKEKPPTASDRARAYQGAQQ